MRTTRLGRTGLTVTNTAFGCLPIQRIPAEEAAAMLRHAATSGVTFFDTARSYTDSEQKVGMALAEKRDGIVIATKTGAKDADGFWRDLHTSLETLRVDAIDVYQFHNPGFVPRPGGEDGLYDAALEAQARGLIRHIGITQHSIERAEEAIESGLYATLQYPFNHLATEREQALVRRCAELDVGFICMKALSGGLITDAAVPFAFLLDFPNAVAIWGFQQAWELDNLLAMEERPPALDDVMRAKIAADQRALGGSFCRGCNYCAPCPVGIPIFNANRMSQLITRSPSAQWMTDFWREGMARIEQCTRCGACAVRCPYGLKPYETLPEHLAFYHAYVAAHGG